MKFFAIALIRQSDFFSDAVVQELKDAHLRITGRNPESGMSSSSGSVRHHDEVMSRMAQVQLDDNGLVMPKKLFNPCVESRDCQNLHREIRWNAKA